MQFRTKDISLSPVRPALRPHDQFPDSMMARVSTDRLSLVFGVLFLVAALAGCRTYGDQYDNTEAAYQELVVAAQQLDESLERAEANVARLETRVEAESALRPYVARYREIMTDHADLLEEIREGLAAIDEDDPDDYRQVHRTLGAVISQQRILRSAYTGLLDVLTTGEDDARMVASTDSTATPHYSIVPVYYYRALNQPRWAETTGPFRQSVEEPLQMVVPATERPAETEEPDTTAAPAE